MDAVSRKPFNLMFDSGSFRDRSSRVFITHDRVFRTLNKESLAAWHRVSIEPFFREMTSASQIVETVELTSDDLKRFRLPSDVVSVLEHERIPFISYPYEWSFAMLREAALLHLRILTSAIRSGLI